MPNCCLVGAVSFVIDFVMQRFLGICIRIFLLTPQLGTIVVQFQTGQQLFADLPALHSFFSPVTAALK